FGLFSSGSHLFSFSLPGAELLALPNLRNEIRAVGAMEMPPSQCGKHCELHQCDAFSVGDRTLNSQPLERFLVIFLKWLIAACYNSRQQGSFGALARNGCLKSHR
ncbi:MAG TPA: hypothetical protein VJ728_07040, partial [Candidatus Binataceae bacterium]|nr:hypothetical protein [Candidatus Binataceae bacterium]